MSEMKILRGQPIYTEWKRDVFYGFSLFQPSSIIVFSIMSALYIVIYIIVNWSNIQTQSISSIWFQKQECVGVADFHVSTSNQLI